MDKIQLQKPVRNKTLFSYCKQNKWTQIDEFWLETSQFQLCDELNHYQLVCINKKARLEDGTYQGICIAKNIPIESQVIILKAFIKAYGIHLRNM